MLNLPQVTLFAFCTIDHAAANYAFEYSQRGIEFGDSLVFTDKPEFFPTAKNVHVVAPLKSYQDGCVQHCTQSYNLIPPRLKTSHMLSVQWDGFVLRPDLWDDEFLNYSLLGSLMFDWAPCNHGFVMFRRDYYECLRKLNLPPTYEACSPCDQIICIRHREAMEKLGCQFPPHDLCRRFARENILPVEDTFGYHGRASYDWLKDNGKI